MKCIVSEKPIGHWLTSDGKVFAEKDKAIDYERSLIVSAALAAHGLSLQSNGTATNGMNRIMTQMVVTILDTVIKECHKQNVLPSEFGTRDDF